MGSVTTAKLRPEDRTLLLSAFDRYGFDDYAGYCFVCQLSCQNPMSKAEFAESPVKTKQLLKRYVKNSPDIHIELFGKPAKPLKAKIPGDDDELVTESNIDTTAHTATIENIGVGSFGFSADTSSESY